MQPGRVAAAAAERPLASVAAPAARAQHDTGVAAWAERIAESVRFSALNGDGEMRVRLEPPGLGSIDIRVTMHHDGIRAMIVAEHETTRALLTNQQHLLQAALDRSELRLAGFSVDLGSGSGSGAAADSDGRHLSGRPVEDDRLGQEVEAPIVAPSAVEAGHLSVRV